MRSAVATTPFLLAAVAVVLALGDLAMRAALMPQDALLLWASAIAAGAGEVAIGRILAGYPTIPFLAATLFELVLGARAPTPVLLAALLLGALAGGWFLLLVRTGLSAATAVAATVLLAFHPALLRTALAGPAEMFLALFLAILAYRLYDLRARSAAPDVMTVGLALLGLTFSHPTGAAIACAATPLLVFAVRPALVAGSAVNTVIALVFPTLFCIAAFAYVAWVFPGAGWTFLAAPAESLAAWASGISRFLVAGTGAVLPFTAAVAVMLGLAGGAPLAFVALAQVRRRRPLVAPALVLILATIAAALLSVASGLFGDPAIALVAAPILAATALLRVADIRRDRLRLFVLLTAGWIGGGLGLAAIDPALVGRLLPAVAGARSDPERSDALMLGGATIGKSGVLVDAQAAPAVVLGRGGARGLIAPSDERFELAVLFARLEAPFVAVPDPQSTAGARDRLSKAFPALYWRGAPGYRLVYQNATWRLFAREPGPRPSPPPHPRP